MGTKHTPGPWQFSPPFTVESTRGPKPIVAAISALGFRSTEANARLIAAAPELLAALCELVGVLGGRPGVMHLPGIHQARAAIAKAEGGAS